MSIKKLFNSPAAKNTAALIVLGTGIFTAAEGINIAVMKTGKDYQRQYPSLSAPDASQLSEDNMFLGAFEACAGASGILLAHAVFSRRKQPQPQ